MGIFDSIKGMAENLSGAGDHAAVASGLLQEIGGSSGIAGLVQTLQQNGAGGLIQQWARGQTQAANPSAIEQSLGGSDLVNNIAQRAGLSPDTVRTSLATILPILVHHVMSNGHVTTDGQPTANAMPEVGTLVQFLLSKLA
jgi:uncharacterized protein YidB (DUF937 family)